MAFLDKFARRLGVLEYLGTWNASTNTPSLASGVGQRGGYYIVSAAGSTTLDGISDWDPGDWAIFNGTAWEKLDNTDQVTSVANKQGDVTLVAADITDFSGAVQGEFLPLLVQHNTRYVSAVDGDDLTASGGIAAPYQTIAAALTGATPGTVIYLIPGTYTEPQITLPSLITIRGLGFGVTEVANGFTHTAGVGDAVAINIEGVNFTSLTLDETDAVNGLVTIKSSDGGIIRTDTNLNVLIVCTESNLRTSTFAGASQTFNECLFINSPTVSGGLSVFENCKFVSHIEVEGSATVRTLDCALFSASEFVNGTVVSSSTPTWETDVATNYLGGYTGTLTKVILADLTDTLNAFEFSSLKTDKIIFVGSKSDFPAPVSGVITLAANKTYFITGTVDLTGDRLVASQNTTIIGGSSENCILISTGLSASTALLSSNWSLPMRNLAITHDTAINLDATGNAGAAIDWFGVNFVNCATVGTVKTYSNFIMSDCALINSANMTFDGTIATVGFQQCLFSGRAGQTTLNFPSTLTITRRIRAIYSSFVAFGGATAINVSTSATIPVESYILDTINFSGGATYVAGVQHDDNKAFFTNCKGINNTAEVGQMFFNGNATQNAIASQSVFEKVEGTTTASADNEKFSHSIGRLTYTGGLTREFVVTASASVNSVTTNAVTIAVRIAKNGATIAESEAKATTSANGRNENFYCQAITTMAPNDYIELFVANQTNTNSLLATDLNVLARSTE